MLIGSGAKKMKKIGIVLLSLVLVVSLSLPALAAGVAPTETFTRWGEKTRAMRPVYVAVETLTLRDLGVKEFGSIVDIVSDGNGNTYVLSDEGQLFSFDEENQLIRQYEIKDASGETVDITGAKGIYATSSTELYIADTKHARVLFCRDGVVVSEITAPESSLIPEGFIYKPVKVTSDSKGYTYILSEGCYYGALLFDPDGDFDSFYGANTVKGGVLTALANLWDRLTQNDVKRSKTVKKLPFQFSDIYIDKKDFVYTCTGRTSGGASGQLRMLSPGGSNILAGADTYNFGESVLYKRLGQMVTQNFCAVQADADGYIYALDASLGLIYIYDTDSNLLAAFGGGNGQGEQMGNFSTACSMTLNGNNILVADSTRNSITIFERTSFGSLLLQAQKLTLEADYETAAPLWESVLADDVQSSLAKSGLAKAAYDNGDYEKAMAYAKDCNDVDTYSNSLSMVQQAFLIKNFVWIALIAIVLIGGLVFFILYSTKHQVVLIRNEKVRLIFTDMVHPFDSFNAIKYKKMGSVPLACILALVFFVSSVIASTESDFRFTGFDAETYNSLMQLVQTVGLVLLWTIANWGASTLMQGNGKLKEVFIVTTYATVPLIIYNLISTPLSHLVANATPLTTLHSIAIAFTAILMCVGLMIIHDYSFPKLLLSAIATILLMILVVFVIFMVGVLIMQFAGFFWEIFMELMTL